MTLASFEEGRLHDHVDAAAQSHLAGDLDRVDGVEFEVLFGNGLTHGGRKLGLHIFCRPGAVEHEGAALLDAVQHVVDLDVGRVVAGDVVGASIR
jgi:hypothetical protein